MPWPPESVEAQRVVRRTPPPPSSQRVVVGGEGERTLHEVWWADGGKLVLRARFRLLSDALRFVWGNAKSDSAWLRLKDGQWKAACSLEALRDRAGAGAR